MKFVRKKNFHKGEELLYVPKLHWFYTIKHMVAALPFFILVLILWGTAESIAALAGLEVKDALCIRFVSKHVLLWSVLLVLVVFVWRIFHYLGTEYGVTNRRLMIKKGVLRVRLMDIPTDRIESIFCYQGILGRIFHYGNICVTGIGGTIPVFKMVARPYALRRRIVEIVEKNKGITVIHGEMPIAKLVEKVKPAAEEEPIYRYGTFVRVIPGK